MGASSPGVLDSGHLPKGREVLIHRNAHWTCDETRGRVSNQGNGDLSVEAQTIRMYQADYWKGQKQMRPLLFHTFIQTLSWALQKASWAKKEPEGQMSLSAIFSWQAHHFVLCCS